MKERWKSLYKMMAAFLLAASMIVTLPGIAKASQTGSSKKQEADEDQKEEKQIRGLNLLGAAKAGDAAPASLPTAVSDTDPMYWMGQRTGGDTNRAMVWFGEYWQKDATGKSPLLWRTLRSDGQGNYGGSVTLLTEYALNAVYFDKQTSTYNHYWCNSSTSINSSDLRAYMNGVGTGAMDSAADLASRSGTAMPYNASGGGAGNIKGIFYANAFDDDEKSLIEPTLIKKESGYGSTSGRDVTDKVFALSGYQNGAASLDAISTVYFKNDIDRKCLATPFAGVAGNTTTGAASYNSGGYTLWWLRSPNPSDQGGAGVVTDIGTVNSYTVYNTNYSARPALNLDPASVIFTSASASGGAPTAGASLTACAGTAATAFSETYAGGFRVFKRAAHPNQVSGGGDGSGGDAGTPSGYQLKLAGIPDGTTATVVYDKAIKDDYITVLVVDKTNGKKWCGRIGQVAEGGKGMIEFNLPNSLKVPASDAASSNYRLFAWTENEATETAYTNTAASDLHELEPLFGIEYDANGGKGTMDKSYINGDKEATFADNKFTRTGYAFTKWNSASDGSGDDYHKDDKVTLDETTGDLSVYAMWEKEKNNLTLDPDGGTIPAGGFGNDADSTTAITKNDVVFGTTLSIADPTKDGYTFAGWSTDTTLTYAGVGTDAGTGEPNPDTVLAESGAQFLSSELTSMPGAGKTGGTVTLTAQWKKNVTAVTDIDPMYWMGQAGSSNSERAMVWFGKNEQSTAGTQSPILWRTLDSNDQGNYNGRITLLSEFIQQSVMFKEDDAKNQKWSESTLRTWMNGTGATFASRPDFLSGFTGQERGLLLNEYHEAKNHSADGLVKKNYGSTERVFALNYNDAVSTKYFSVNGEGADATRKAFNTTLAASSPIFGDAKAAGAAGWWLRSPDSASGEDAGSAASVGLDGSITYPAGDTALGARPAVNLDPSEIVFTTASNNGEKPVILKDAAASATAGTTISKLYETTSASPSAFSAVYPSAADYNAGKTGFRVFTRTADKSPLKLYHKDGTARIWYDNLPEGEYIQVMLVQTSNKKKWTGRIKEIKAEDIPAPEEGEEAPTGATGSISFTLPDNIGKDTSKDLSGYRLFAWTEREGTGNNLGTADKPETDTLDKLYGGEAPVITMDSGTVTDKDNVGEWAKETKIQLEFASGWSAKEKSELTIQYKLGSGGTWTDYTCDLTDPTKSEVITVSDEGNTTLYSRCVLKNGANVSEMSEISYKIVRVDETAPDISSFKKKTAQDTKDSNKTKVKLTFQVTDKPTSAAAGSTPSQEEQDEEVDDIYNSGIKNVYYTEEDLEALQKDKTDAGSVLKEEDLEQLVTDNKAEKITALKNADGTDADVHGALSYEILLDDAASQKARFAAAVDEAGNIFVTMVYDGEKLLDVTAPGKMMFTAMTNLSGDSSFQSPDYTIRNNSDLSKVKVSLNYESTVSGTLGLAKQETVSSQNELALYVKTPKGSYSSNPFGTELSSQTKAERQFGLLTGDSGDAASSTLLGTLNQKPVDVSVDPETAGSAGRFTFEAGLFPYQKNGILTKSMLRGTYQAQFHFEVTVPDEVDAVRSTGSDAGGSGTE